MVGELEMGAPSVYNVKTTPRRVLGKVRKKPHHKPEVKNKPDS